MTWLVGIAVLLLIALAITSGMMGGGCDFHGSLHWLCAS